MNKQTEITTKSFRDNGKGLGNEFIVCLLKHSLDRLNNSFSSVHIISFIHDLSIHFLIGNDYYHYLFQSIREIRIGL